MTDAEPDLPGDDPESRDARRLTKLAVWAFAVVELVVIVLAFAFRNP